MDKIISRQQELQRQISELEDTLAQLRVGLQKEVENEQHKAIENLEKNFDLVNNKFKNLQDFWQLLREEVYEMFNQKKD